MPAFPRLSFPRSLAAPAAALALLLSACASSQTANAAATVNGQPISLASYNTEVKLQEATASDQYNGVDVCQIKAYAILCKQLKETALGNLISQQIVQQYAQAHHITVSQSELDARWALEVHDKFDNKPKVAAAYAQRLHVTVADLQQQVRNTLLQNKVLAALTANLSPYTPAVQITRVAFLNELQYQTFKTYLKHMSFNAATAIIAKNNTACSGAYTCGRLGWVPTAFLGGAEVSLAHAPVGKVIDEPAAGLYLLQARLDGRNPHYLMNSTQMITMRNRVLNTWLHQQLKHATVRTYVSA